VLSPEKWFGYIVLPAKAVQKRAVAMKISIQNVEHVLSISQTLIIMAAALIGAIKFKVFEMWKHTYRTEMECRHSTLANGEIVFIAEYGIHNTGERPLRIDRVLLQLCRADQIHGGHLVPDRSHTLVMPTVFTREEGEVPQGEHFKPIGSLGDINKGERSIFTMRCLLRELPDVVFVIGGVHWKKGLFQPERAPSLYSSMYVKALVSDNAPTGKLARAAATQ
jgi:hypothetical protein